MLWSVVIKPSSCAFSRASFLFTSWPLPVAILWYRFTAHGWASKLIKLKDVAKVWHAPCINNCFRIVLSWFSLKTTCFSITNAASWLGRLSKNPIRWHTVLATRGASLISAHVHLSHELKQAYAMTVLSLVRTTQTPVAVGAGSKPTI